MGQRDKFAAISLVIQQTDKESVSTVKSSFIQRKKNN